MNTTTSSLSTAYVGAAHTPQIASELRAGLARMGRAVWQALEAHGHARAVREMRLLQDRWEDTNPNRALHMDSACQFLMQQAPHH
jgi:hypothetical protein